ncbi:TetR/AcrR family transcriptional regulator [Peribacillus cavernae]|uniref:TetR/AcrR family transcriptional regulator n=1 Tax=Peribacillus cavernae TaxID=1674310 RepID=A0A3S0U7V0_9BACI|nr:TetR/AcrR family transcriptional regulator [Peribacillus cavernae]MDQ0218108.1 AcrR family transcriptional regulator [Peribacillus cavernae]RUQ32735.1 TetR/AcrR family transcriptional regulator [Peribacillus cavernae]
MQNADEKVEKNKTVKKRGRPRLDGNNKEHVEKRNEIIETAAKVFREYGYDAGTIKDVAEVLDVTTANVYYYIKSKEELLYEIILRSLNLGLKKLDEIEKSLDSGERLKKLMEVHVKLIIDERNMFTVLFDSKDRLDTEHYSIIREKENQYLNYFRRAIKNAIDDQLIPPISIDNGLHAIMGMCNWVYKWHKKDRDPSYKELADDWFRLISQRK